MLRNRMKITPKKKHLIIAALISFSIALFFCFWHPAPKDDLYRYFAWLDLLKILNGESLINFILSRGEFVTMAYAYLIAQIGNYGLFQFFPTFISLFIVQYIAIDYGSRKKIKARYVWLSILIFACMYEIFMVASGVRSTLGFAIISLALYREFVMGKKCPVWLYLVSLFIHLGMAIPIALRIFMAIKSHRIQRIIFIITIVLLLLPVGEIILGVLGDNFSGDAFTVSVYKLGKYLTGFYPISGPYFYKIAKVILLLVMCATVWRKHPQQRYVLFYLIASLASLPTLDSYLMWHRMLELILIGSPLIIMEFIRIIRTSRYSRLAYVCLFFLLSLGQRCN